MKHRHDPGRSPMAGFSLIEMMITVTIIGILAATAIPAYSTFVKNTRLLAAEVSLTNALKSFSITKGYSPGSDMLADLVVAGDLNAIPNDPWTPPAGGPDTGAADAIDWYYVNDGNRLYLYAKSHPKRLYTLPSFGLPPLATPTVPATPPAAASPSPATPAPSPATPAASKQKNKGKGKGNRGHRRRGG